MLTASCHLTACQREGFCSWSKTAAGEGGRAGNHSAGAGQLGAETTGDAAFHQWGPGKGQRLQLRTANTRGAG